MTTPSESPYDRQGRPIRNLPRQRRVNLVGNRWENAFTLAHRGVGEWRLWRSLCDLNGIDDPLEMRNGQAAPSGGLVSLDGQIDFSEDLGLNVGVVWHSQGIGNFARIEVTDVAVGVFEVRLRKNGELGPPAVVLEADFFDVSGTAQAQRIRLESADAVDWIDLRVDIDAWLVIWMARDILIGLDFTRGEHSRTAVLVPAAELGT